MKIFRHSLSFFVVLSCPLLMAQPQRPATVPDKAAPKVLPFGYSEVTLLDSPFLEARERTARVLLALDPDRLLHTFRLNADLPSSAAPLEGWEAPNIEVRGHTIGHYLTACALMYANTADERFKDRGAYIVGELQKVQKALADSATYPGYLSAFPEEFIDRVEHRKRVWAPYYTLHKIMAGLLDMYLYCGSNDALDMVSAMAEWVRFRMDRLTKEQQQAMLQTEFGGMNDILAQLYSVTADPDHLRLAGMFDHEVVFGPLSRGVDSLDGLHGNTQIPKMIGAMREHELTGEKRYFDIASFFWERVVNHRSYVIGGNTNDEHFTPVGQMAYNLGAATTETCNSYNMLKLTRALFCHAPEARYMEFFERVLYNHILASQDPATGMYCYYISLKPGAYKTYSTPHSSFWCCVGTGMENPERFVEAIYMHDEHSLLVNLFVPSEVRWRDKGVVLRQETQFPRTDGIRLVMAAAPSGTFSLRVRVPAWATSGAMVTVNGARWEESLRPGSYLSIVRGWTSGDVVELVYPMTVSVEPMPDDPAVVAFLKGPIVLAGDLGAEGIGRTTEYGPEAPAFPSLTPAELPVLVAPGATDVRTLLYADRRAEAFVADRDADHPASMDLLPFHEIHHRRYTVYWRIMDGKAFAAYTGTLRKRSEKWAGIEKHTIDRVDVHVRSDEIGHGLEGTGSRDHWYDNRKGREAAAGRFSYVLAVDPEVPMTIVCTYRGSEGPDRRFEVSVDGKAIASEDLTGSPPEFTRKEYPVPYDLTRGKKEVTVGFFCQPNAFAGPVFDVRTVRRHSD